MNKGRKNGPDEVDAGPPVAEEAPSSAEKRRDFATEQSHLKTLLIGEKTSIV